MIAHGMAAMLKSADGPASYRWPTGEEMVSTLTMTHAMGVHNELILNYASWSISVEFWAYVLFTFVGLTIAPRRRPAVWLLLFVFAYAVAIWASLGGRHNCLTEGYCLDITYDFGYARCVAGFFLGALAWWLRDCGRQHERQVQLVSAVAVVTAFALAPRWPTVAFAVPLMFGALVWSLAKDRGPLAPPLSGRIGALLGERSYSMYMLHPVLLLGFLQIASRVSHPVSITAVVALYVLVLLVCSGWTYRFVEQPSRRYFNVLASKLAQPSAIEVRA